MRLIFTTLLTCLLLAGCGGGGSSPAPAPVPAPDPGPPPADPPDTGGGDAGDDTGDDSSGGDSSGGDSSDGGDATDGADGDSNDGDATDDSSSVPFLLDEVTRSLAAPAVESETGNEVLRCAVMLRENEFCSFNELTLLGMETADPTIDDVMSRVVVTHDWMASRFREILESMPDEILLMMRGLTGVVISSDIRPSFYTARTGAIYLDPAGMWLTEEERAVISQQDDPRSEDIQSFKFAMLWRYVINDTDVRALDRTLEQVSYRTAALLFHELAHANDFFPPDELNTLDRTIPIFENISQASLPSTQLANALPLTSSFMRSLARAAFNPSISPTSAQLEITAEEVAAEFPTDVANDYYNYATSREDLAMAFEEAMMLLTLGIDRDVAAVELPEDLESCSQLTVAWGQRNRIGDPAIGARSLLTVERILPESAAAVEDMLASLPAPLTMRVGEDWCSNIVFDAGGASRALHLPREIPVEDAAVFLPIH